MRLLEDLKRLLRLEPDASGDRDHARLRKDERDAAVLAGKYPRDTDEIDARSEISLARHISHPYF